MNQSLCLRNVLKGLLIRTFQFKYLVVYLVKYLLKKLEVFVEINDRILKIRSLAKTLRLRNVLKGLRKYLVVYLVKYLLK